jgi:Arylsulfotransferase (ASST)
MRRFLPLSWPTPGHLMAGVSILAVGFLCCLGGAAIMHFGIPPAGFLRKAFTGGQALQERERARAGVNLPMGVPKVDWKQTALILDNPGKTYDGFTLYTTTQASRATLIDMRGNVVHQWEMPFRKAWPQAPHIRNPFPDDQVHWFRCHLYPNGDLLAVYHADGDTPYGYGLAKLDKDSRLLWVYSDHVHHDVAVGEDDRIYTLTQKLVREAPPGLDFIPSPYIADYLVVLSPGGKELEKIAILDAFRDSPFALTVASIASETTAPEISRDDPTKGAIFHANSVKVLSRALAPQFPLFKSGQVLVSLRNQDTLAMLDTRSRSVTWAARGIWRHQHDPEFLENGHLLVYDNKGSRKGSRILEYDPLTQAIPWSYPNDKAAPFKADWRGVKQRLPNGNTLIVAPDAGAGFLIGSHKARILEVTPGKEVVWEYAFPYLPGEGTPVPSSLAITGAQRFGPDELRFLKASQRGRP